MFKKIFPFIICAMFSIPSIAYTKSDDQTFSKLESGLITVENPFESQLPKVEKPQIVIPDKPPKETTKEPAPNQAKEQVSFEPIVNQQTIIEKPLPNVTINGIIWNSDRPQAIINGKITDIGDTISEIRITDIRKTGIDGLFDGRTVTLQP